MSLFPQPGKLPRQQQNVRDLDHFRRTDGDGNAGKAEPGGIADFLFPDSQRGQQQENQDHVKTRDPLPALEKHFQIQPRHEEIGDNPHAQRGGLYNHTAITAPVTGSAVNQADAIDGRDKTKSQKRPVRLPENVSDSVQHAGPLP